MRDAEVIAAADEHDMAMVFTGVRHFRHDAAVCGIMRRRVLRAPVCCLVLHLPFPRRWRRIAPRTRGTLPTGGIAP